MSESAASPFIKASKEKLLHQCAEELERLGQPGFFEVHFDFQGVMALIGNLQLALRHPGNDGIAAQVARFTTQGLVDKMREAGYVANAELASLGFDPAYDDARASKPQIALMEMQASQDKGLKSERDRIAASECVRLMGMLTDSDIPEAKALATIIGARLATIADAGAGESLALDEIEPWVELGRQLCIVADVCPCDGPHCIRCGCCAHRACEGGCFWVVPTLCSKCVGVA